MDIFQTIYAVAKDICGAIYGPIAKCVSAAISLPEKFMELSNELTTLCHRRNEIKDGIESVNAHKAPTRECKDWIEDVDAIENQVRGIEEQHLVHKRCLKGCCPDVSARARLYADVEHMIAKVKQLEENSKFEAGFLTDLPLSKVKMIKDKLNKQLETLCRCRDDIKDAIHRVHLQKAPTKECNGWIADVDEFEKQVKEIEEQHLVNRRYLEECSPDDVVLAKLCEDVERMIIRVKELQENSKFEAGFLTTLPLAQVEKMEVPNVIVEASVRSTLQKILDHIKDEQIQKIGIWGMGGVGKTTLMKLLNNMPKIRPIFQVVIWVTISNSWSITKVQDKVAKRLSLKIKDDSNKRLSEDDVKKLLLRELEGKKYLLLLDDVWESMDFPSLGIPTANRNNGCKIVLTTRDLRVCHEMETDWEINVQALPEEEAWKMFETIVGNTAVLLKIQPIAKQIVGKCDGLPLALEAVGKTLRKEEDVHVWSNLLTNLRKPYLSHVQGMSKKVFVALKASYDHLDSHEPNPKNHFLYCGLYPEDYEIKKSQLIKYWRAEGLLSSGCTEAEASDEGHTVLRDLIDASLLKKCEDDDHVKMHDVMRDCVLNLTSKSGGEKNKHIVQAGLFVQGIVDAKEWEEACKISFMDARGYILPDMPNCPKLETLLLQANDPYTDSSLKEIPESFFNLMPSLGVLDLSGSSIKSLPSSISNLASLRALLLKCCRNLEALPREIHALTRLEELVVTEHKMRDLPTEMWDLTSLKCLKLKGLAFRTETEVMIPNGKISKMSQLEHFQVSDNIFRLHDSSAGVVEEELCSLTRLSSLVFDFRSVDNLAKFVENSKAWSDQILTKFKLYVNRDIQYRDDLGKNKRGLIYEGDEYGGDRGIISSAVKDVIKRSEFLKLVRIGQPLAKLSDLGVGNISGIRACIIDNCNMIETIADEDGLQENAFANLEELYLQDLGKLRSIFFGCKIPPSILKDNFKSLRSLNVIDCPILTQLLSSWGLLSQLLNLEQLYITDCGTLEEMISVENEDANDEISSSDLQLQYCTPLPKLKLLRLEYLEEFVSISCKENVSLSWPSLEELHLKGCPKLKMFMTGANDGEMQRLKKLTLLDLSEFVGFGDGVVPQRRRRRCWPSLEKVRLERCSKLKIFPLGAGDDDLQRLKELRLVKLSEFVGFGGEGDVAYNFCWPSLTSLSLNDCQKLETFPLAPHHFPNLQKLVLEDLPELVSLGDKMNGNDKIASFATMHWESLFSVNFSHCPKLGIFPFTADSAPNLKRIQSTEPLKWKDDATKLRFSPLVVE